MKKRKVLQWTFISLGCVVAVSAAAALMTSERVERWRLRRLTTRQLLERSRQSEMNPLVWEYLGRRLHAEKRHAEELEAVAKSVALDPNVAQTHAGLGVALAENGQAPQAVYELNYALKLNPRLASAHFALGNLYMNQKMWRDAINSLQATVKENPQHQRAWFLLAVCYGKVHEAPTKRTLLERLTRERPDEPTYQKELAYEYLFFNQFAQAEACAQRALKVKPKDVEARYILGRALAELADVPNEYRQAQRELDVALRADAHNPHGRLALGILHFRKGDYAPAARELEHAIAHGVPETKAKMLLGQAYLRLGREREGKSWLNAYRREGETMREIRQLELRLAESPTDVPMRMQLAKLFLRVGRLKPAEEQLHIILQRQPDHAEALRHLKALQPPRHP
jgi:tetratricopeptide (TPR) repeat protein